MINVEVNGGEVHVKEANGTGLVLMSELCCIVRAVCTGFCADEDDSEEMTRKMVLTVASALMAAEEVKRGVELEDDENVNF